MGKKKMNNNKKGIFLTMPEAMLKRLEDEKDRFAYHTVQEIILEAIRDKFFRGQPAGNSKRGRPKKPDYTKALGMKKIFVKRGGVKVDV